MTSATSADKRELNIKGSVKPSFTILDDNSTEYHSEILVVENLNYPVILGTRFLNENEAKLNFKEGTITIDGKVLNWKPRKLQTPETTLIRKTKVCILTSEEPKEMVLDLISTYKQNNPLLGTIPFVTHKIILTDPVRDNFKPIINYY
eukprot:GAHX01003403.1.p1 GENE.GAHX01003403.1~~GAHX01003403.1.p1  ORF type:complete len:148 (-),score=15.55 GAHX01003403.1:291-734(-)